jgi:ABC-2 type transport system permease protein
MDALGFMPEAFTDVLGFYTFTMTYIILCGAIQAMNLGMGILAKEASGKTADFLLTKPVTRGAILTAKLLACLTALGMTFAVFTAVAGVAASVVTDSPFGWWMFVKLSLPLLFVQLIFAALGFLIAAIARKIKSVLPLSLSTVFAFFIIGLVQGALKDEGLRCLTPFKYFEYGVLLKTGAYEGVYLALSAIIVLVAVAVSYGVYLNKDIHAA